MTGGWRVARLEAELRLIGESISVKLWVDGWRIKRHVGTFRRERYVR
jgi:hypothetical protein